MRRDSRLEIARTSAPNPDNNARRLEVATPRRHARTSRPTHQRPLGIRKITSMTTGKAPQPSAGSTVFRVPTSGPASRIPSRRVLLYFKRRCPSMSCRTSSTWCGAVVMCFTCGFTTVTEGSHSGFALHCSWIVTRLVWIALDDLRWPAKAALRFPSNRQQRPSGDEDLPTSESDSRRAIDDCPSY